MFPLGHAGLALGLVIMAAIAAKRPQWLADIDMRLVLVMSMLPDIIDKPLGHFILGSDLNNGRIIAHTLLFVVVVAVVTALIFRRMFWAYTLPVLLHQLLDFMWELPRTMFWPLLGFGFKSYDIDVWEHWLEALTSDPYVIVGEVAGFAVLVTVFIAFGFYRKDRFLKGLKRGRLI